jgi:hypothetical protein
VREAKGLVSWGAPPTKAITIVYSHFWRQRDSRSALCRELLILYDITLHSGDLAGTAQGGGHTYHYPEGSTKPLAQTRLVIKAGNCWMAWSNVQSHKGEKRLKPDLKGTGSSSETP